MPPLRHSDQTALVDCVGISRRYGSIAALDDLSLSLYAGEVHALVGENGAGKSTLVRLLRGMEAPDSGCIERHDTRIAIVPQYPRFAGGLTVCENIAAIQSGARVDRATLRQSLTELAQNTGISVHLERQAAGLGDAELREAAILAALVLKPDLLVLDEPTVALHPDDKQRLLATIRRLAASGTGVLFVSHDLVEVAAVADRVSVLVRGKLQAQAAAPLDAGTIQQLLYSSDRAPTVRSDEPLIDHDLSRPVLRFHSASIRYRAGTLGPFDLDFTSGSIAAILGFRDEGLGALEAFMAGEAALTAGSVVVCDRRFERQAGRQAFIRLGLAFVPSDRTVRAVANRATVVDNAILQARGRLHSRGWRQDRVMRRHTRRVLDRLGLPQLDDRRLNALSGGQVQRLILARELEQEHPILVVSEPDAGLDLHARIQLRSALRERARAGACVLILTASLDVAREFAERVVVLRGGAVAADLPSASGNELSRALAGVPESV